VAVERVSSEPVSVDFPDIRENTRNILEKLSPLPVYLYIINYISISYRIAVWKPDINNRELTGISMAFKKLILQD
jgi:hypothetical protein